MTCVDAEFLLALFPGQWPREMDPFLTGAEVVRIIWLKLRNQSLIVYHINTLGSCTDIQIARTDGEGTRSKSIPNSMLFASHSLHIYP